ncbi:laccase domain-containing protein [Pantoea ananatis]
MSLIIPQWPAPDRVRAVSTLRQGGVSEGNWRSLNLGSHVGDKLHHVAANRERLIALAALPAMPQWLEQVHSTRRCLPERRGNRAATGRCLYYAGNGRGMCNHDG